MEAQDPQIGTSERCGFRVFDESEVVRACGEPATREYMVDDILFHACNACAAVRDVSRTPLSEEDEHVDPTGMPMAKMFMLRGSRLRTHPAAGGKRWRW
jgi:hypothetical protein